MKKLFFWILWLALLPIVGVQAQIYDQDGQYVDTIFHDHVNRQAEDFVTVSLCYADPTDWRDDAMGVLGHAFFRLQCPTFDLDYCYSYESEPLEGNLWRAIRGDLKMGMFAIPTEEQLGYYREWNRTVKEYQLNLPPTAKQRLWKIMDQHVEKGAHLKWDLYRRGCALSLVHFLNAALQDTEIEYSQWPKDVQKDRITIMLDELEPYPWTRLFALIVMDPQMAKDCPNEEKLLTPQLVVDAWKNATVAGQPLLTYKGDLVTGDVVVIGKTYFTPLVALFVLIALISGIVVLCVHIKKKTH